MTQNDVDFDTWFSCVSMQVLDFAGVEFQDQDSVRTEYDQGRDANEVAAEIILEYGGMDE